MTSASDDMAPRDPKFPSVPFCSSVSRSQNWEPRDLVAPGDQLRQVKTRDRQRAAAKPLQIAQLRIGVSAGLTDAFPAIIDTAVAVSTLMLVALGDKPARRTRTGPRPPIHKPRQCNGWRSHQLRMQKPR